MTALLNKHTHSVASDHTRLIRELSDLEDICLPNDTCFLIAPAVWEDACRIIDQAYKASDTQSDYQLTLGPLLTGHAEMGELRTEHWQSTILGILFPVFTDGRGYSLARLIREQGFNGELRACGDILVDQIFYLSRCGFDSFCLREDQSTDAACAALTTFSDNYQSTAIYH